MTGPNFVRIVSLLRGDGTLSVYPQEQPIPVPGDDQILIRVDAAPINPADLKSLFCSIPTESLETVGDSSSLSFLGRVPTAHLSTYRNRIDVPLPVGNEGTGLVVSTGTSPAARSLLGQRVSVAAGGMFSEYQLARPDDCIVFPPGFSPEQTAAAWINPMTALAMVDTMRREAHSAIVLTAAASSLGQMVNRLCIRDGVPIVNVVRSEQQLMALRALGATHVCNSTSPEFEGELLEALLHTGATLAFDATGGGNLAGKILHAMEQALAHANHPTAGYGSMTHKQLYFFGGLDPSPVQFSRSFGMAWGIGGWLLQTALAKVGSDAVQDMKLRVQNDITTIFSTSFKEHVTFERFFDLESIRQIARLKTGDKYLVKVAPSL